MTITNSSNVYLAVCCAIYYLSFQIMVSATAVKHNCKIGALGKKYEVTKFTQNLLNYQKLYCSLFEPIRRYIIELVIYIVELVKSVNCNITCIDQTSVMESSKLLICRHRRNNEKIIIMSEMDPAFTRLLLATVHFACNDYIFHYFFDGKG